MGIRREIMFGFVIAAMFFAGTVSALESVMFYQVNFKLDGIEYPNTEWGRADFYYTGRTEIMYFNLTVNGSWQVQNMPLLSPMGVGYNNQTSFYFDLGTSRGYDVHDVNYGYAFTSYILGSNPPDVNNASVWDADFVQYYQSFGAPAPEPAPAQPIIGGQAKEPEKHAQDVNLFPNQQAGPNECTPTAVSNSLLYLNNKQGLGIDPNQLSISKMKEATKWDSSGASVSWPLYKDAYMKLNGLPFSTRVTRNPDEIAEEIDRKQDIELTYEWIYVNPDVNEDDPNYVIGGGAHTVVVVGITKVDDANGLRWVLEIADDVDQDDPCSGTGTREITVEPNIASGLIIRIPTGSAGLRDLVIECPEPNWFPNANVRQHWKFRGTDLRQPQQDMNSPYNRGSSTMTVSKLLLPSGSYYYTLSVGNDFDEDKMKKVRLTYIYSGDDYFGGGSDFIGPSNKYMHHSPFANWNLKSQERNWLIDGNSILIEVTEEYELKPQPPWETFEWWMTEKYCLLDVRLLTDCIPMRTPCEEAHEQGKVLEGDLNNDCTVDFKDFVKPAENWLIHLWPD